MPKNLAPFASALILLATSLILPSKPPTHASAADIPAPPTTQPTDTAIDQHLTKQISDILTQCQSLKPGMTRADLLKIFTTEGGLSNAKDRTYVHRLCPYIKLDVTFTLTTPNQNTLDEKPTDTINSISKPYLDWTISD